MNGFHRIDLGFAWILRGIWLGALYLLRRTCEVFGCEVDVQGEVRARCLRRRLSRAVLDARARRYENERIDRQTDVLQTFYTLSIICILSR